MLRSVSLQNMPSLCSHNALLKRSTGPSILTTQMPQEILFLVCHIASTMRGVITLTQARQKRTVKVGGRGREAREILSGHVWSEESQRGRRKGACILRELQDKEQGTAVRPNRRVGFTLGEHPGDRGRSLTSSNVYRVYPRNRIFQEKGRQQLTSFKWLNDSKSKIFGNDF